MTERRWIAERRGRYVETLIVTAASRKEAEEKLRSFVDEDIESQEVEHINNSPGRIVREVPTP